MAFLFKPKKKQQSSGTAPLTMRDALLGSSSPLLLSHESSMGSDSNSLNSIGGAGTPSHENSGAERDSQVSGNRRDGHYSMEDWSIQLWWASQLILF
jgi:hypothetical protein